MKKLKISVIMAVYNGASYLLDSIASILNQTFRDFEFIIIDDESTDDSLEIIQKFAYQDQRIKIIKNKQNSGQTKSLNRGLKIAQGQYIARQDADDFSVRKRLMVQYSYLKNHPEIFLVGTSAILINEQGKRIGHYHREDNPKKLSQILARHNYILHSGIMFCNHPLPFADCKRWGVYREKFYYSQDYDFYLRLLTSGKKITNLPNLLIRYRYQKNSLSFQNLAQQKKFAQKARKFYNQRIRYGEDQYASFDPQEILQFSPKYFSLLPLKIRIALANLVKWRN